MTQRKAGIAVLVNRHFVADLLVDRLKASGRFAAVRRVGSRAELVRAVRGGRIDIVFLDPCNVHESVFETARILGAGRVRPRLIFVACMAPAGWVRRALELGASAFLGPCAEMQDVLRAVEAARRGQSYFSPCAAAIVAELARRRERREEITARELDVLRQVCRGASSKQIARRLGLSSRTIEMHRARLMRKAGARSAAALAAFGCQHHYVDPPGDEGGEIPRGKKTKGRK